MLLASDRSSCAGIVFLLLFLRRATDVAAGRFSAIRSQVCEGSSYSAQHPCVASENFIINH